MNALPLNDKPRSNRIKATGTDPRTLVPLLAPTPGNQSTFGTIADKMGSKGNTSNPPTSVACVTGSEQQTITDQKRAIGLEPTTFSLETKGQGRAGRMPSKISLLPTDDLVPEVLRRS